MIRQSCSKESSGLVTFVTYRNILRICLLNHTNIFNSQIIWMMRGMFWHDIYQVIKPNDSEENYSSKSFAYVDRRTLIQHYQNLANGGSSCIYASQIRNC